MLDLAVLQSVSMPKAASSSGESEAAEFPFQETLCPLSRSKNPSKPNCQRTQHHLNSKFIKVLSSAERVNSESACRVQHVFEKKTKIIMLRCMISAFGQI
jgi:hypothetical protein